MERELLAKMKQEYENRKNEWYIPETELLTDLIPIYLDKITYTNNLMVYLGSFQRLVTDMIPDFNQNNPIKLERHIHYTCYSLFADLEHNLDQSLPIPITECEQWMQQHTVIIPPTEQYTNYFITLQRHFFKEAITLSQEEAVTHVLKKCFPFQSSQKIPR